MTVFLLVCEHALAERAMLCSSCRFLLDCRAHLWCMNTSWSEAVLAAGLTFGSSVPAGC